MNLDHRLREGMHPSDSIPKIFMYLSPDDSFYYDKLIDLFLSSLNCTIYFTRNSSIILEKEVLENFNLFAILVTDTLLNNYSTILDQYNWIAKQCNIPVFFFRISKLDFIDFESIYGCLHLFDATDINSPLEKENLIAKLGNRLFEILEIDTEIQEIKKSFESQLFLSYRKKDSRFLKPFLRMIHTYPRLRDVAIWYDDFLVPGKDYNQSIITAMENSSLFLLLVTNNLLEDDNYVLRIEYDYAIKNNKEIVPFEFADTDKSKLQEKYQNLPLCVNVSNDKEVNNALANICERLNLKVQNNSPRHLYLIGLAYLLGIYVEKNEYLSTKLITTAAEKGYEDGLLKLGEMYSDGHGVLKDYNKAISFLENYILSKPLNQMECLLYNYLQHKSLSIDEYDKYLSLKKGIAGVRRLLQLYKTTQKYNICCFDKIFSFCKSSLEITCAFLFLANTFTNIVGYENTKGKDGKYKILGPIYREEMVLTVILPDNDLIEVLHMIVFDFCTKMEMCVKKNTLQYIISSYEKTIELINKHNLKLHKSFVRKLISELISICVFTRDVMLEDKDMCTSMFYNEKAIFYEEELKNNW